MQVARASAVDDAVALAERIAGAAGLNADWLDDRVVGVSGTQDLSSSGRVGGERGLGLVQAAAIHNAESLVPRPYGDHLPRSRSIAMALLVVTGVVLALGDRWRWGAGALAMVVWMAVDAAVLRSRTAARRGDGARSCPRNGTLPPAALRTAPVLVMGAWLGLRCRRFRPDRTTGSQGVLR